MSSKFFTNQNQETSLLKKFEGVFEHVPSIRYFDALVGYFRASGYFKIRPFLEKLPKIRILVGINVDGLIKKYHDQGQYYLDNPEETKEAFVVELVENIQDANYASSIEEGIIQFIEDLVSGKIELRAHPNKKIHAKVYIFKPVHFNEHAPCEVITGSSNLTDSGLGSFAASNYEFNVSLRDYEEVKFASDEFDRLWSESVPILHAEADKIKSRTYLKDDFSPFEIYIKMLIEYFGKRVEYDPYSIDALVPEKYMRLKYQSDAANQGYSIMMKHNGFILADVVGLGKTIVACMILKKFIYENGTHSKVLVVVPPAIKSNWQRTVKDFQLDMNFDYVSIGSLHKILDENNHDYSRPEDYDLVVVDESHKFRNDYTGMYVQLQDICKRRRAKSSENGDTRKKVILVSATPLNNRPQDIESQLYLFQDKRNSSLENIQNLQDYFKKINETYKRLSEERTLNVPKLKQLFEKLRNDVIEPLVIRRTRTDIENNKDYLEDITGQGITFPKVDDPIALRYKLDEELGKLFFETVELITAVDMEGNDTDGIGYYRYRAIEFLENEEDRKLYTKGRMSVESISIRLAAIMRTLLVKRLESSFFAFTRSIERFSRAIDNMINMLDDDRVFIAPDLDINKLLEEGYSYDQIEEKVNDKEGNNRQFSSSSFDKKYRELLLLDKTKVDDLTSRWQAVKDDPKLTEFLSQMKDTFFVKKKNESGKLVIFTESKETADYLKKQLDAQHKHTSLIISSENRQTMESVIRNNFDANLEEEKWKDEFDVIITTEVLAEGINLHRSNTIVNYDVPWNATRLMQRIGRVNRIGSRADQVFVYNYYPSAEGDRQIRLVNNALRKLQAFHTAFGEDNKIFSILEEKGDAGLFGNNIEREENEILKYLKELREFRKKNGKLFNEIARLPHKARCGREAQAGQPVHMIDNEGENVSYSTRNATLSYLKSENHPGIFCLVTPDMGTLELNFLQAAKLYKADTQEASISLHELHHQQVLAALNFFKLEKNQLELQGVQSQQLSAAEKKANKNLSFLKKQAPTEQKKKVILKVIEQIKKGRFASKGLPTKINHFFDSNQQDLTKDKENFYDRLFKELLDDFSGMPEESQPRVKVQPRGIVNAKIVLSQSFK